MNVELPDYSHPLHAASLYIEDLKYGPGPRRTESVTEDQIVNQVEGLLRDAGLDAVDARELVYDTRFYGASLAHLILAVHGRVDPAVMAARSIFLDGLVHGIAVASRLRGEELPDLAGTSL